MIAFEAAQQAVAAACAPLGTEIVGLSSAVGRALAESVRAQGDLVPFARSAMDGFAVRSVDAGAAAVLPVRGRVFAERSLGAKHEPRTATEIATGAPIPSGADAVVPVEAVLRENGVIRLHDAVPVGAHIFPPGEDARAGEELLAAGRRIAAADAGLLAAAGHARVMVYTRPRAVVLTTGDEVVAPDESAGHGQIRNSNALVIAATLAAWGCNVVGSLHVRDDASTLRARLAEAATTCDLVVTSGGASVGERDLVKGVLRGLDARFAFDAVALRPAKPTAFATLGQTRIAVLPGNPSSAYVALHEFVRIAALTMAGERDVALPRVCASLDGRVPGKAERTYAAYATLRIAQDGFIATPLGNQCSALTRTASMADGFIIVPPGRRDYSSGDRVAVDVLDWSHVTRA